MGLLALIVLLLSGSRTKGATVPKKPLPVVPRHVVPAERVVERVLAQRGMGRYQLGGGANWTAPTAFDALGNRYPGTCDCTRLIAYGCEYPYEGWYTDRIVDDARGPHHAFVVVPKEVPVRAGDIIVTGRGHGKRDHGGVIVAVLPGFERGAPGWEKLLRVAHAWGRGGSKRTELDDPTGAVRVWDAAHWKATGYIIRPLHVTD